MGVVAKITWLSLFLASLSCALVLGSVGFQCIWFEEKLGIWSWLTILTTGGSSVILLVFSMNCFDIYKLDPSDKLPFKVIWERYKNRRTVLKARSIFLQFIDGCKDIRPQQDKLLLTILKRNKDTEYGKENKFSEIDSFETFRNVHRITSYDTFKPYIDRICDGESNLLVIDKPFGIAKTSGTTGNPKLFLALNYWLISNVTELATLFLYNVLQKGVIFKIKYKFSLGHKPQIEKTKCGFTTAPMTYFYPQSSNDATSPTCAFDISHENTSFFVHSVFGLREKEVGSINMFFAHQAYSFFTFLEENWVHICDSIETGRFSKYYKLVISDELRSKLENELHADTKRAAELRKEFKTGNVGLAKRLWPCLEYCRVTTTGSMVIYGRLLQKTFLKNVVLVQNAYGGSEGLYGLNVTSIKDDPTYHLAYPMTVFEFIPEENIDEDQPDTLLAHQVKEGKCYEVVVTNYSGLYRYRVGDVVKISHFEYQCPVIEFLYRTGQILNILGEKTTETVFFTALEQTSKQLNIVIKDYTTCEDIHLHGIKVLDNYVRHYVLFVEVDKVLSEEETKKFDVTLCHVSQIYNSMRTNRQSISAMEVIQVQPGTFMELKNRMIKDTQNPQFKLPRAMRVREHLLFLMENAINNRNL